MDRISVVEDIMIEALKVELPDVRTIETRPIPMSDAELQKVIGNAPFVYIENNGGDPIGKTENGTTVAWRLVFNLFVAAKNLRSKQDAQRGSYEILERIRRKLDGNTFTDTEDPTRSAGPFIWRGQSIFADLSGGKASSGTIYQVVISLDESLT